MAETTTRTFRVDQELWDAAMGVAADRDEKVSDILRAALHDYTKCTDCACELCGLSVIEPDEYEAPSSTAAIYATEGKFSETDNPEVQAWIDRAKELLAEGAVGVSVSIDLNPADLPANPEDITDEIMAAAGLRIRHVAIVDTPAFSGAYLSMDANGNLTGPLVFEGEPTGDLRSIELDKIQLDESLLPVPILFDIAEGDHTGPVIGFVSGWERVAEPEPADAPVTASAHAYPAYLFSEPEPTAMTVHAPDEQGFRRYSGILAPTGVCHKGRGGCYKYRGADLGYFHRGARIPLDDGTFTRVGPLVFGGVHADDSKMDYNEALARTDDARRVFAMGRCYDHPKGLLFSGVLMPDADVMRIQATSPSAEIWPNAQGKLELKTALQVNEGAWPVAASTGGLLLVNDEPVIVEEPELDSALAHLAKRIDQLETVTAQLFAKHLASSLDDE